MQKLPWAKTIIPNTREEMRGRERQWEDPWSD